MLNRYIGANGTQYRGGANGTQNRVSQFQEHSASVLRSRCERANTKLAYEPKKLEYNQYCNHRWAHDINRHIVNEESYYGFMCYNAHREKYAKRMARDSANRFDFVDYTKVMKSPKFHSVVFTTFSLYLLLYIVFTSFLLYLQQM